MLKSLFPKPLNFDYLGNDRGKNYVRGVTAVACQRCKATGTDPISNDPENVCRNFLDREGRDTGIPVCRNCGGYGEVSP